ncbi:alpha-d-galacturonidase [Dyadobacter psychrophilus]|uniref:Glycosyl hydrolase family 20, domain 2 n=1 Tax=Dyadobacter psychrophilus TaxID=651661 RepID=A0A1T5G958_9BACT|nr:hypothetical protein [Dyadobacter psychrophilus]SKC04905.1 hypothetical protein SAMN05660293_03798 [Dyadobacter psychrophilus]
MRKYGLIIGFLLSAFWSLAAIRSNGPEDKKVKIYLAGASNLRIDFGTAKLSEMLKQNGFQVAMLPKKAKMPPTRKVQTIFIGLVTDGLMQMLIKELPAATVKSPGKEGFQIFSVDNKIIIAGSDASGALYGCLEMAERVKKAGKVPEKLAVTDQPEMVLRGTCIGIQKPSYLPGRTVYEYPYTPENFPWFYDKSLWIKYLDMLVENRMNSLYLWNGHPFASLVKLKDYPYAVEVDDETFRKNEEIFGFFTQEADKRGIWVIQMFYNIIVSKPFAEKHGIKTQDRKRAITPLIADYTQKSIAAFVTKYPNVGLLITLGEAMEGDESDVEWFTKTIIPGVKEGLSTLKTSVEPPIVLRGHDTNPQLVMKAALPLYKNLYTMNKYNGEALTTYEPRGPWAKMHKEMSELGSTHIDNVHILANLEPFRYGSANFIQKSVQAMHDVHGANGLHLYPEASYWDWPFSADNVTPRQFQMDRDWVWYKAWARYAWNCRRDRNEEVAYWTQQLGADFDIGEHGKEVLEAYEQAGEIAPKLLRRFGITNGNRQTLTLGMTMSQLVNPKKYRVWPELYNSDGPEGETLTEYIEKETRGENHVGETPVQIIDEVTRHGKLAAAAIDSAAPHVKKNKEEFDRVRNDMYCNQALADFFAEKVKAAALVLKYQFSNNVVDLETAVPHLERSVNHFKRLADLTKSAYLYANSMQTAQRRVPVGGDDGKNKTWVELLPYYEKELASFKNNISQLKNGSISASETLALKPAEVTFTSKGLKTFSLEKGQRVFEDEASTITESAGVLKSLKAIRTDAAGLVDGQTTIKFKSEKPVKVLVGYFQDKDKTFVAPPNLETDASANDFGQAEVRLAAALKFSGLPDVNVHTFKFPAGENVLTLGQGKVLVLGFIDARQDLKEKAESKTGKSLDWLFE